MMRYYIMQQVVHFGALRQNLNSGDYILSDGISRVEHKGKTYNIPAVQGAINIGWARLATDAEVALIKSGEYDDVRLSSKSIPDPAALLNKRLEEGGMDKIDPEAPPREQVKELQNKPEVLKEMEKKTGKTGRSELGLPKDWPFKEHWQKRKKLLKDITDVNQLNHLRRYYKDNGFEKHVKERIKEVQNQGQEKSEQVNSLPETGVVPDIMPKEVKSDLEMVDLPLGKTIDALNPNDTEGTIPVQQEKVVSVPSPEVTEEEIIKEAASSIPMPVKPEKQGEEGTPILQSTSGQQGQQQELASPNFDEAAMKYLGPDHARMINDASNKEE